MRTIPSVMAVLLVVGVVTVVGDAGAAGATRADTRGTFAAPSEELYLLSLLNADRRAYHRRALTLSPTLSTVAVPHSRDMAVHAYFGHQNRTGQGPFQRLATARIPFSAAAENLGLVRARNIRVALMELNRMMMAQPSRAINHRWIILDATLHRVGIGIYVLPGDRIYLTEDFIN